MEDYNQNDNYIMKDYLNNVGCRAPYQVTMKHLPLCSSKEKMKQSMININSDIIERYPPPCRSAEKISYGFVEEAAANCSGLCFGVVKFTLNLFNDRYKEITQTKAIDFHAVVGNSGGYIGLFCGYAIVQLPDFILMVSCYLRKIYGKRLNSSEFVQ